MVHSILLQMLYHLRSINVQTSAGNIASDHCNNTLLRLTTCKSATMDTHFPPSSWSDLAPLNHSKLLFGIAHSPLLDAAGAVTLTVTLRSLHCEMRFMNSQIRYDAHTDLIRMTAERLTEQPTKQRLPPSVGP